MYVITWLAQINTFHGNNVKLHRYSASPYSSCTSTLPPSYDWRLLRSGKCQCPDTWNAKSWRMLLPFLNLTTQYMFRGSKRRLKVSKQGLYVTTAAINLLQKHIQDQDGEQWRWTKLGYHSKSIIMLSKVTTASQSTYKVDISRKQKVSCE